MSFTDLLDQRAKSTLLCVGLDPRARSAAAAKAECLALIKATADYAACFKPNAAFFEAFGAEGWTVLREVIAAVPNGIPVILDAKRGDIADTAAAYAASAFDHLGAHAITVSPYMGLDALKPFLKHPGKAVFALCKTSNKASDELQGLTVAGGEPLFVHVARRASTEWAKHGAVGLVVGATHPAAIRQTRAAAPNAWFLCPGVGAQGGDLAATITAGLRHDRSGVLVNVSRAIAQARDPRAAAQQLRDAINLLRAPTAAVAACLRDAKCVKFGKFTLKSGTVSPIYLDLRNLVAYPEVLQRVAVAYGTALQHLKYDRLVGLPYAALPIATAVAMHVKKPLIYPRREAKQYGTKAAIEGEFSKGDRVVVIDDLISDGGTKVEAITRLRDAGLHIAAIVVLVDREQGGAALMRKHGVDLVAVATLAQLLQGWRAMNTISDEQAEAVRAFMAKL